MVNAKNDSIERSYLYINDFFYLVIRPAKQSVAPGEIAPLIYCSGVNTTRFLPITAGRHRLGLNPAVKGLQILNIDVRSFALSSGVEPKTLSGSHCADIATSTTASESGDTWRKEIIQLTNAATDFPDKLIQYAVRKLLELIILTCLPEIKLPDGHLPPEELQKYLEDLCRQYGVAVKG